MNIRATLTACLGAAWALLGPIGPADASTTLYDGIGFVQGQQTLSDSFSVSGPGTLSVTLSDIAWPEALSSLNLTLSTAQGLLGPEMGPGSATFQVAAGGNIFAQWFGTAQGPLDAGVYGLDIQWTSSQVSTVPLPTSIALLLSGLVLLAWQRRQRGGFPGQATEAN